MERHEILDAMSELKLYGMRASFDEIAGKGSWRRVGSEENRAGVPVLTPGAAQ